MVPHIVRLLAIFAAALVLAFSPPALSKSINTATPSQGQAQSQADKPEPPGQTKKDETPPGNNGHDANSGTPPGQGSAPVIPPGQATPNEVDEAQRAVKAREALPLARIVAVAETRSTGHVINARLVRVDGVLLYQLTLLDEAGRSWREYYYARTGNPVALP
jgi:uncharacterized membrane protein YkoI